MRAVPWILVVVALGCSGKRADRDDDPVPAPPPPAVSAPPAPPECRKDDDCAPHNCCYAIEPSQCEPRAFAHCDASKIVCAPYAGSQYACACVEGRCRGTRDGAVAVKAPSAPATTGVEQEPEPGQWVTGALDAGQVLPVIIAHGADVRACQAKGKTRAYGVVDVVIAIKPSGAVEGATPSNAQTSDAAVAMCLVQKIKAWRFPAKNGPTRVVYSFKFK